MDSDISAPVKTISPTSDVFVNNSRVTASVGGYNFRSVSLSKYNQAMSNLSVDLLHAIMTQGKRIKEAEAVLQNVGNGKGTKRSIKMEDQNTVIFFIFDNDDDPENNIFVYSRAVAAIKLMYSQHSEIFVNPIAESMGIKLSETPSNLEKSLYYAVGTGAKHMTSVPGWEKMVGCMMDAQLVILRNDILLEKTSVPQDKVADTIRALKENYATCKVDNGTAAIPLFEYMDNFSKTQKAEYKKIMSKIFSLFSIDRTQTNKSKNIAQLEHTLLARMPDIQKAIHESDDRAIEPVSSGNEEDPNEKLAKSFMPEHQKGGKNNHVRPRVK